MHDQPGQGTQHKLAVVQPFVAAAFGVGNGYDAVECGRDARDPKVKVGERLRGRLQCLRQPSGKARRAGGRPHDDDHVARADTSPAAASEAQKCAFLAVSCHLLTGAKGRLVHFVGDDPILEIRLLRDGEIQRASVERLDHTGVAYVLPRRDWPRRHAERKPPGQQRRTLRDRFDGETVADQNRGIERELRAIMLDGQPCFKAARGDGDIITGLRQAGDFIEGDRAVQVGFGGRVRAIFVCHHGSPFSEMRLPGDVLRL